MQTPDTPQLTPIEKAIEEIGKIISDDEVSQAQKDALVFFKVYLNNLLPYERQYLRDVAENAWDAAVTHTVNSEVDYYLEHNGNGNLSRKDYLDKKSYLNKMKTLAKIPLKLIRVEFIPQEMEFGELYYSEKYKVQNHLCVCGCGQQTPFPIKDGEWSLIESEKGFSITPSILQRNGCKSHYIITNSVANIV